MDRVWYPITDGILSELAKKVVMVRHNDHPEFGEHAMIWNPSTKLWTGRIAGPLGWQKCFWGLEFPAPTHWAEV